MAFIVYWCA